MSYARVSRLIQVDGDGLRRQKDSFDEAQKRYGVTIASAHEMIDMGLSAYKGKNLESGALGVLLREAEAGKFPPATILFVESLDRLSRSEPEDALRLLLAIIKTGLVVVTTIDWQEYRKGHMDMMALFKSIMIMATAHEESAKKAYRTKQSYAKRYAVAQESGVLPVQSMFGWITKDPVTGKAVFDGERKPAIVERICDMSLAGFGLPKIAKTLNAAGEKPFAMDKKTKGRAEYWTVANVAHILKSPALYGDYHRKNGEVLEGIFPAVITKETFHRMQAGMASRLKVGRGRKGKAYSNLFGGIGKCQKCGEPMTIRNPKPGRAIQFYCKGTLVGNCDARPWNYEVFEKAFLGFVNEIDLQSIIHGGSGSRIQEITNSLQTLEGQSQETQKAQDAFIEMIKKNPVLAPTFTTAMVTNQTKLDSINEQVKVLEAERNKIRSEKSATSESNLVEFPKGLDTDALFTLRAKTAQHIRTVVEQVRLKRDPSSKFGAEFTVEFKGGGTRLVYVNYTDPRKPYAVTNAHGGVDIIPSDLETATELQEHVLGDITKELEWLVDHATSAEHRQAITGVIEKFEGVVENMRHLPETTRELIKAH